MKRRQLLKNSNKMPQKLNDLSQHRAWCRKQSTLFLKDIT